jgi:hypothetical protein
MGQKPRARGARASEVDPAGRHRSLTAPIADAQLARLPRRLLRKITVEPADGGWRARIVGFDAAFWSGATSRTFSTRRMAIEAAKAASRQCGLPVIVTETLTGADGPIAA